MKEVISKFSFAEREKLSLISYVIQLHFILIITLLILIPQQTIGLFKMLLIMITNLLTPNTWRSNNCNEEQINKCDD